MTNERIEQIRARVDAALDPREFPGPWEAVVDPNGRYDVACQSGVGLVADDLYESAANLIANAPADLTYLLTENARLQAQIDAVLAVCEANEEPDDYPGDDLELGIWLAIRKVHKAITTAGEGSE